METSKFIISVATVLVEIGLLLAARKALEQIKVSKEDIERREKRESIGMAIKQIEFYRKFILPEISKISDYKAQNNINFKIPVNKLHNFDYAETTEGNEELKRAYINDITILGQHSKLSDLIFDCANALESYSMAFTTGYADSEIALFSVAETFCNFVEENCGHYCYQRKSNKLNLYHSTIKLYKKWSQELEEAKLNLQQGKLNESLREIKNNAKNKTNNYELVRDR